MTKRNWRRNFRFHSAQIFWEYWFFKKYRCSDSTRKLFKEKRFTSFEPFFEKISCDKKCYEKQGATVQWRDSLCFWAQKSRTNARNLPRKATRNKSHWKRLWRASSRLRNRAKFVQGKTRRHQKLSENVIFKTHFVKIDLLNECLLL